MVKGTGKKHFLISFNLMIIWLSSANVARTVTAHQRGSTKIKGWGQERRMVVSLHSPLPACCAAVVDSWWTCWHDVAKAAADKNRWKRIWPCFILVIHWGGCWKFHWSWPWWNVWSFIDVYVSELKQCSPLRKWKVKPALFLHRVSSCCSWISSLQHASKLLVGQL